MGDRTPSNVPRGAMTTDVAVKVATVVLLAWAVLSPDLPQFQGKAFTIVLAFAWAVTTAVVWELAEFATFVQDSPEAVTAYADTLGDLALGMTGGLVAAVVTARLPHVPRYAW